MSMVNMSLSDVVGGVVGLILTLMVFSYLLGDNGLFRLATHIFIGVTAGYVTITVVYNVLWPQLIIPFLSGDRQRAIFTSIPLLLGAFLLLKSSPRLSNLGNLSMAFLVGTGAAVGLGGALLGTLFPQTSASMNVLGSNAFQGNAADSFAMIANGGVILVGTITTLAYFHFGIRQRQDLPPRRPLVIEILAGIGQVFIGITFGALFAGAYSASLAALISRLQAIIDLITPFIAR